MLTTIIEKSKLTFEHVTTILKKELEDRTDEEIN